MARKRKRDLDPTPLPQIPPWAYSEGNGVSTWRSQGSQSWLACHVSDTEITFECYRYHPAYDEEPIRDFDRYSPVDFLSGEGHDEFRDRMGDQVLEPILAEVRRRNPHASPRSALARALFAPRFLRKPDAWLMIGVVVALLAVVLWLASYPARRLVRTGNDLWNGQLQELPATVVSSQVARHSVRSSRGTYRQFLAALVVLRLDRGPASSNATLSAREFPSTAASDAEQWLQEHFPAGKPVRVWRWTTRPDELSLDQSSATPSIVLVLVDLVLMAFAAVCLAVFGGAFFLAFTDD